MEKFKWEHNKSDEAKAIAGTLVRYNYENLVDMHNKTIDELIKEFEKIYLTIDKKDIATIDKWLELKDNLNKLKER